MRSSRDLLAKPHMGNRGLIPKFNQVASFHRLNLGMTRELGQESDWQWKLNQKFYSLFFAGESELLKYSGQDLNRQHLGRPYFRSLGKTYRIRNGYTVTLVCSIENLGKKSYFNSLGSFLLNQCAFS